MRWKIMNAKNFHDNYLFELLEITDPIKLRCVSKAIQIESSTLRYYNDNMLFPLGNDLAKIINYLGLSEFELKLKLGIIDSDIIKWISKNSALISYPLTETNSFDHRNVHPDFETEIGTMYSADCINVMRNIADDSIDLIFADPPFNLNKSYESGINDYLSKQEYLEWTESWLKECVRILSPGGALFVYNIPYWATYISCMLNKYLSFRHWIAIYMRGLLPIRNKLNPSHYSLLYYIKGETPKSFNTQRIPMPICRHCGGEIHDYGGKKNDLHPNGLSISDVWNDINPVRHSKFKNRTSNELPLKLLYRIISLASDEGDVVFDPFGGSGTTYAVAEYLRRRWIGAEIGNIDCIVERITSKSDNKLLANIEENSNIMFTNRQRVIRQKNGFWTDETLKRK